MALDIPKTSQLEEQVFSISNEETFVRIALEVFKFQYSFNPVYQQFCMAIRRGPDNVNSLSDIPFLPISFFKTHKVSTGEFDPSVVFKSSGTTGAFTSRHFVKDTDLYIKSFTSTFEKMYGDIKNFCIIGLLPSYLEQGSSSLVFMVNEMIQKSGNTSSGFYLHDFDALYKMLLMLEAKKQKTVLFGVTYALLDFASQFPTPLHTTTIIETGGMKGRKKEQTRQEIYTILKDAFQLKEIHSEYGMTELLSQAYAINGVFRAPEWMRIFIRDETDPFATTNSTGGINIIDLSNIYSCSFIATEDVGRILDNNFFEVLGRMDNADIRGCSQLYI